MKKIIFKLENEKKTTEIKDVDELELLTFICEALENLILKGIIPREVLLTAINTCLTIGPRLSKEPLEDKEIRKLIDEVSNSMLELFRGLDEANNNK